MTRGDAAVVLNPLLLVGDMNLRLWRKSDPGTVALVVCHQTGWFCESVVPHITSMEPWT